MSYDANSIKVRDFRAACRATPGMYIGASGVDAAFNCFLEIFNNSCDEAMMGRGNRIVVEILDGGESIKVTDSGAGIPRGSNSDCEEVLVELFTTAHSSGKFDTTSYFKVRGCHGCGGGAVCVCSTNFEVWTRRDGGEFYLGFTDGIPNETRSKKLRKTQEHGTTIRFTPDKEILHIPDKELNFNSSRIRDELKLTSYFIPNVEFVFVNGEQKETFYSKNGLCDFTKDKVKTPLHPSFIYGYKKFEDDVEVEVFAQWTGDKETSYIFSNGALNIDGGTPEAGAKAAFTRTVNSISKHDFESDMIRKGLFYVVNVRHPKPIFQNQTKNRIQNPELRGYTQSVFTEAIKDFSIKHRDEFEKVVSLLEKLQKADVAAERARKEVLEATKEVEKNQKRKVFSSDKLKDAEFLGEDSTLLLVEGLSAASSIVSARDPKKYGVLALRGKMLNLFTATDEEIYQNEEIKLLLSAMNINPLSYDSKKLRYGRIGILVDADSDGFSIGLLIMCALYKLAPRFIEEGRLYWMRSPLYIVKTKEKEYYYYSDIEFNNRKQLKGAVQRNKGLGSLSPEQARASMFTEEFQRFEQLMPDEDSLYWLSDLMGDDSQKKRDFIFENLDFSEIRE